MTTSAIFENELKKYLHVKEYLIFVHTFVVVHTFLPELQMAASSMATSIQSNFENKCPKLGTGTPEDMRYLEDIKNQLLQSKGKPSKEFS